MALNLDELGITPAGLDAVRPFAVEGLDVRGRAVALGPVLEQILGRHDYPEPVSRLVAEATVLTSLLGTSLKFDGRFTLQTQTEGPVSMVVVDFASPDAIRACATFDPDRVDALIRAGKATPEALLGHGHLAMTIDQGKHMQRYQGLVELDGISLEEVARRYFERSEQIPTEVRLGVGELFTRQEGEAPSRSWTAGGILIQFLPEAPERLVQADIDPGDAPEGTVPHEIEEDDAWVEAKVLVDTVKDVELTDPEISVEMLLFRLFHERGVRLFEPQPIADKCRCSREKIENVLANFSEEEVRQVTVDGKIVVTCEFCSAKYEFGN
ncbi:MAG: Hsp33 family molecular chaperone [Roseibium sp.]|uniref:Hsp33 family molecular chaperone n=1 Tax=Roseibium sp. TaxID=1936156 RepID=UPI001B2465A9|nr:Hsp33 family molecular chaperone [Roseibium sp.]MBO6510275.1 Hsp33 family molecular chaperone [Roseibium sp.]MBO6890816.1 Hsp33 family molecular chaperone [Roseibium sp.]MBO6931252.1 Hsp33 family molecular chaperone [Roseibium sp.]